MAPADAYANLIPHSRAFLAELAENNTRDWFQANKDRYEAQQKAPALALLDDMTGPLADLAGLPITTKLFRANRDVRFSKDKTPYTTHLHMLWAIRADGLRPAFFFGIKADYVTAGWGYMGFEKAHLDAWRAQVDGKQGPRLAKVVADLKAQGLRMSDPALKRVPAPFDKDHPRGDLLRQKSLTFWTDIEDQAARDGLVPALSDAFGRITPLIRLLPRL